MKHRIWIVLSALALVLAACGGGEGGGDTTAPAEGGGTEAPVEGGGESISIVANPWTASALNAEIAAQLITEQLGNPAEVVEIDENTTMFTGLADGTVDVVLEVWPSGIVAEEQAFIDDGSVVNIGELGAIGKIGWFTPQYVIDEHPDLATWEGYADPANAALFATAETGDLGRFLGTDPSYSQYDEAIIANLELPFQVQFSGSEAATVAELDRAFAAQEPILMYWWTPTAAVAQYELVNVLLPEYNEECYADPAAIDCDYPEDILTKFASGQLAEKAPNVQSFLEEFTITTEDQLGLLPSVELEGEDASDVAAQWIADNEDVWSAWLADQ
jgi:glycine betaine/proline transport system substrate-binding protein